MSHNCLTPVQTPITPSKSREPHSHPGLDQGVTPPLSPLTLSDSITPSRFLSPAENALLVTALLNDRIYQTYGPSEPRPSPAVDALSTNNTPPFNNREDIRGLAEKTIHYIKTQKDNETKYEELLNENMSLQAKLVEAEHQNRELRSHIDMILGQFRGDEIEFRLSKMEEINALKVEITRLEDKLQASEKERLQELSAIMQHYGY